MAAITAAIARIAAANVSGDQGHAMPGGFFMVHKDELVRALKSANRDGYSR